MGTYPWKILVIDHKKRVGFGGIKGKTNPQNDHIHNNVSCQRNSPRIQQLFTKPDITTTINNININGLAHDHVRVHGPFHVPPVSLNIKKRGFNKILNVTNNFIYYYYFNKEKKRGRMLLKRKYLQLVSLVWLWEFLRPEESRDLSCREGCSSGCCCPSHSGDLSSLDSSLLG